MSIKEGDCKGVYPLIKRKVNKNTVKSSKDFGVSSVSVSVSVYVSQGGYKIVKREGGR